MWKIVDDREMISYTEAKRGKYKDYRFYFLGANDTDYVEKLYGTVYAVADNDDDYHEGVASLNEEELIEKYGVTIIGHGVGFDYSSPEYDKGPLAFSRLVSRDKC
jgi:hypothetical protein